MNKIFSALFICLFFFCFCIANELDYDYYDTEAIPIELTPLKEISTKNYYDFGEDVGFEVVRSVYYKGKAIALNGDKIHAKIEMSVTSGMNGFPAEIFIGDFQFPGISSSKITDSYIKTGQNRCLIVYPIKWALTPIPFVGSLTNLIKGGHAKIKTTDKVIVYYHPNWK